VIEYDAIDKEYAHEYDNLRVPKRVLYITIKNLKINIHKSENPVYNQNIGKKIWFIKCIDY